MLKRLEELEELYAKHKFKKDFDVALYLFIQIANAIAEQNIDAMLELRNREEEEKRKGVRQYVLIMTRADKVHLNRRDWIDVVKLATEYVLGGQIEKREEAVKWYQEAKKSDGSRYIENETFIRAALSVVGLALNYVDDDKIGFMMKQAQFEPEGEVFKC